MGSFPSILLSSWCQRPTTESREIHGINEADKSVRIYSEIQIKQKNDSKTHLCYKFHNIFLSLRCFVYLLSYSFSFEDINYQIIAQHNNLIHIIFMLINNNNNNTRWWVKNEWMNKIKVFSVVLIFLCFSFYNLFSTSFRFVVFFLHIFLS